MELVIPNYDTKTYRKRYFEINGVSMASIMQLPLESNTSVWDAPQIHMYKFQVLDAEHLDLLKDALEMAGELFEEWSADTGKEITEG